MRILLTGGQGFVGFYLATAILTETDWDIISLERLSSDRISSSASPRVKLVYHDFRAPLQDDLLAEIGHVDYVIHAGAAMTVVPRPDDRTFVQTNVTGTFNLLEAARKLNVKKFIYISSSEVFGVNKPEQKMACAVGDTETVDLAISTAHKEDDCLEPSNVYAAAKAGGEMLCRAYFKSFRVPIIISRPVNLFGAGQHPCRFISQAVRAIQAGETLEINSRASDHHAIAPDVASRQWLHVQDYVDSLLFLLEHGQVGEAYHTVGAEFDNLFIADRIGEILSMLPSTRFVEAPSTYNMHLRLNGDKLHELGWRPKSLFRERLEETVAAIA